MSFQNYGNFPRRAFLASRTKTDDKADLKTFKRRGSESGRALGSPVPSGYSGGSGGRNSSGSSGSSGRSGRSSSGSGDSLKGIQFLRYSFRQLLHC